MSGVSPIKIAYDSGRKYYLARKELASAMEKEFPKPIQMLKKVDKHSGEVFNILITAVGTAFVAPFFIAYNPLSKTDEDTKKYSAMRQPVSAVLAVATQAGLVIPWNKFTRYLSNNGKLGDNKIGNYFNQQGLQDEKYILSQVKKANPKATKEQLEEMVKAKQADQYAKLFAEFKEKGTITIGRHPLPEQEVRGLIAEVAGDLMKQADANKARYDGEQYTNKIKRAEYLFDNRKTVIESIDKLKNEISTKSNDEEVIKYLKGKIKEAKSNGTNEEWLKILEDDLFPKHTKDGVLEKLKQIKTTAQSYAGVNRGEIRKHIARRIDEKVNETLENKSFYEKLKKSAKEGNESISSLIEKLGKYGDDHAIEKVIDKYSTKVSRKMKAFSAVTGLLVSLAIMPVTCCALNWIYPRFMDKFFPELSKPKKEGGKKCQ